eukprot:s1232_g4.t1
MAERDGIVICFNNCALADGWRFCSNGMLQALADGWRFCSNGMLQVVQTPELSRSGWLDNFYARYHQELSFPNSYFWRHFQKFATVKFSGRDRFCTGLHPVSQTQRKECPWQPPGLHR